VKSQGGVISSVLLSSVGYFRCTRSVVLVVSGSMHTVALLEVTFCFFPYDRQKYDLVPPGFLGLRFIE